MYTIPCLLLIADKLEKTVLQKSGAFRTFACVGDFATRRFTIDRLLTIYYNIKGFMTKHDIATILCFERTLFDG